MQRADRGEAPGQLQVLTVVGFEQFVFDKTPAGGGKYTASAVLDLETGPQQRARIDWFPAPSGVGHHPPQRDRLAVLRLIGAGLFDRYPVIVAAHLGGVLPWLRDRLAIHGQASAPFPDQPQLARPVGEYLDQLYVDTVAYGLAPLEYCYSHLGAGRMLFGTDHPYAAPGLTQDLVDRLSCTQAERDQILAGNAQRLLRLEAAVAEHA